MARLSVSRVQPGKGRARAAPLPRDVVDTDNGEAFGSNEKLAASLLSLPT